MAQLPCAAIGMMFDRVSAQLIRRRNKCGITLLYLNIQTRTDQTGDATQIARGRCVNGRTADFANTGDVRYGGHLRFLLMRACGGTNIPKQNDEARMSNDEG